MHDVNLECPSYPCSLIMESCKYCYCPFYPCKDFRTGGEYLQTKVGYLLWSCKNCVVIHRKEVADLIDLDQNEQNEEIKIIAWKRISHWMVNNDPTAY
jgi:Uncharacterized protein containing a Zn-finger-like domain